MNTGRMRRLTDRQVAVIAVAERLGSPTFPDLHFELPDLALSTVLRTLEALGAKGLITSCGNPQFAYLGVGGFGAPRIPPEDIVRFSAQRKRPSGS